MSVAEAHPGPSPRGGPVPANLSLDRELQYLHQRLRGLLPAGRRMAHDDPLQSFRGLVVTDAEAIDLLEELDQGLLRPGPAPRPTGAPLPHTVLDSNGLASDQESPLDRLARIFHLSSAERLCLVAALAPELDTRYGRVFAFLQDDVTRKGLGVGLLLDLIGAHDPWAARRLFLPGATLLRWQLLHLCHHPAGEPGTLLTREAHLDECIVEYLLAGEAGSRADQASTVTDPAPHQMRAWQAARDRVLEHHAAGPFVLSGPAGVGQRELAQWLAEELELPLVWIDARQVLKEGGDARRIVRAALLSEAALAVDHADAALANEPAAQGLAALAELACRHLPLTLLIWNQAWQPLATEAARDWSVVELPLPTRSVRMQLWHDAMADWPDADESLAESAAPFPLTPGQIRTVAGQFRQTARAGDRCGAERLQQLCRAQLPARVPGVSESESQRSWDDLVLPADVRAQLEELCGQARQRGTVLGRWGFESRFSGGKGLHALFAGPPGTGKTLAAEVLAGALGRRLWRMDLPQLVSKYIGETEKNIERVFRAARADEVLLFFDEADALFGRRSEVKDAHDRYANQEVSYLLQQMEEYEGVAVLATNLARNLDEAFLRRLQFVIDFPLPDEQQRRQIWAVMFPPQVPLAADVDLAALARAVRLSGGHIRNIALAAAYLAADGGVPVGMAQLWHASRREYQKLGQTWAPPTGNGRS